MTPQQQSRIDIDHTRLPNVDLTLGRNVEPGLVSVPNAIHSDGDFLVWRPIASDSIEIRQSYNPTPKLFDDFWNLAFGTGNKGVVRFAQQWGVLALWPFELPDDLEGENPWPSETDYLRVRDLIPFSIQLNGSYYCVGKAHDFRAQSEPMSVYREIARYFDSWIRITALCMKVEADPDIKIVPPKDEFVFDAPLLWRVGRYSVPSAGRPALWQSKTKSVPDLAVGIRRWILKQVDELLNVSGLRVGIGWRNGNASAQFSYAQNHELLGALALQLVPILTGKRGLFICDVCAEPYLAGRLPRAGQGRYCPRHPTGSERATLRKRRERERKRNAKT